MVDDMNAPYILDTLSNGLRFLYVPVPHAASAYVSLVGSVGRRAEEDTEVGAAHFLEHLFFDGTKKRPNSLAVNQFIERIGALHNGSTWTETVNYFAKATNDQAENVCDFIADIFQSSTLTEIDKERKVIAQEAAFKRDDPVQSLLRRRYGLMFPGQRAGRTIFDEDRNLPQMTEEVIRGYHARTYVAENFLLCIAGGIARKEARQLADRYFAGIRNGEPTTFEPVLAETRKQVAIVAEPVKQSKLALNFTAYQLGDSRAVHAELLAYILGKGLSSRLSDALRGKRHLAYSVRAFTEEYSDHGLFTIMTFMDENTLQEATTEIFAQLQRIATEPVSPEELTRAKNMMRSRLQFAAEDIIQLGDMYASQQLLTGSVRDIATQVAAIEAVTTDDILAAARAIFADAPKVNIVTRSLTSLDVPDIQL